MDQSHNAAYAHGAPSEPSLFSQSAHPAQSGRFNEDFDASRPASSAPPGDVATSNIHRSDSVMSQSQTLTPSRGGTLKKKNSLKKSGSVKRSSSRRSLAAGSVKSLALGDRDKYEGSDIYSAFFTPVPTRGNPTDILANRFQDWRRVLKDLIAYFRESQKAREARSKSLLSLSNLATNISGPIAFLAQGGIGDATDVLQSYHKQALAENNRAKNIEEEIMVQLMGLRSDLSQKIKEIKNLSGDFKNSVEKETESTRKAVRGLQEALGLVETDSSATSGKGDPYIIKLGVERQIDRQIDEENYLHKAFLNLENSGRELESIVVGEIQKAYNALSSTLKREADDAYEAIENLRNGPIAMAKDHEWDAFVSKNENFVDPRMPVRRPDQIHYPGKDAPAAAEVRAGMLERKSKYLKSYTPGWYVLSPTHLHEFKSPDRVSSQTPVMSLYLHEQKLGSHSNPDSSSHKFMLKGRQTGGMHRGHGWVFRAESRDTMLAWYEDVKNLTEKTGIEREAFVRKHARSLSTGSATAPSVSSDGIEDEDEADRVPYSASASQVEHAPPREQTPPRPQPGGRFPSDVKIDRHLLIPRSSPSSGTSSDDHDAVAAAGALPGSGIPFGASGHQVQEGEYGKATGKQTADGTQDSYQATQATQDPKGANPSDFGFLNSERPVERAPLASAETRDFGNQEVSQQPVDQSEPSYIKASMQHDTEAPAPVTAGTATAGFMEDPASDPSNTSAVESNAIPAELGDSDKLSMNVQILPPSNFTMQPPIAGSGQATPATMATTLSESTMHTEFPLDRPEFVTRASVQTISDLHVPGEFPKPAKV